MATSTLLRRRVLRTNARSPIVDKGMEYLSINFAGKIRREKLHNREYLVAPLTMIVPGVLNGSQGALLYTPNEIKKNVTAWNGMPLTVGHPTRNGQQMSGRDPSILNESGIGNVYNVHAKKGKLQGEGWFDVEALKKVDNRIYDALLNGRKIELSTGLFTENFPASRGASFNGKPYTHIARNYRPDHLAILPDQVGACSVNDGCGVNVNAFCPTGPGGGQDNSCGGGVSGSGGSPQEAAKDTEQAILHTKKMGNASGEAKRNAMIAEQASKAALATKDPQKAGELHMKASRAHMQAGAYGHQGAGGKNRAAMTAHIKAAGSHQKAAESLGYEDQWMKMDRERLNNADMSDQSAPATVCKCGGTCDKCKAENECAEDMEHNAVCTCETTGREKCPAHGSPKVPPMDNSTTNQVKQVIWQEFGKLVGIVPTDNAVGEKKQPITLQQTKDSDKPQNTLNAEYEKSYNDRQSELQTQLNKRFPPSKGTMSTIWVSDLYDDYLVYQKDGLYFRLGYVEKGGNCILSKDKPVRVDRVTTYEEVDEKSTDNAFQPKSLVTGQWKRPNAGTGKGDAHEAAQRGALYLDTNDHALGASAKAEVDAGHNPASWVEDEGKWDKAKAAAGKGEYDADTYWAVVTHIYKQMGGGVKGDTTKNTAVKKTQNSSVGNRSHSARRQRLGTKSTGVLNMKRDDVIDSLVTNCDCFDEEDRDTLNSLDDKKLKRLHHQLVDNAMYADEEEPDGDEEMMDEEEEMPAKKPGGFFQKNRRTSNRRNPNDDLANEIIRNRRKPQTADEWFATAPPEIQSAVRNAMTLEQQAKKGLLDQLTANVADDRVQTVLNQLKNKSIDELKDLLAILPPARAVAAPSFIGAAVPYPGSVNNERALDKDDDDILPIPTINYAEEYAARTARKAKVS